jgi:hypothetical protein
MLIPGLFQALTKEYFVRTTIIMVVTMAVVVLGDLVGTATDPIAEHAVVTTIIAVTILAINVTKGPIITTLVDLVILAQVITTMEIVTAEVVPITEIVTAEVVTITEIVTAEVDTQIAIHVLAHIQALVEDLATNAAIALEDDIYNESSTNDMILMEEPNNCGCKKMDQNQTPSRSKIHRIQWNLFQIILCQRSRTKSGWIHIL